MFGKRAAEEAPAGPGPARLKILVRQRSLGEDAAVYALAQEVVEFVNHALRDAQFRRHELPPEAMWAFHVDYFIAQVNNGGYGQFLANSRWTDFVRADIRDGLAAIGLEEAREAFESLETFSVAEPGRFQDVVDRAGFGEEDPFIEALDKRFYAGLNERLTEALRTWLAALPCLEPLDDETYAERMRTLPERNPLLAPRQRELAEAVAGEERVDPVVQAMRYVCRLTPGDFRFRRWLRGQPFQTADGRGSVFEVETDKGVVQMFFTRERAAVAVPGEETVRSRIPMAMVELHLARRELALPDAMLEGTG